jgi:hypothetical protein
MAWRTAGRLGCGGGPEILFFPFGLFEPPGLEEGERDQALSLISCVGGHNG